MTTEYQEFVLAAHEAGLDVGTSSHGSILHAVDFDTDSVRAKAKGEPDELACGKASDADRVDDGEEREICGNCLVELGVKEKRAVTDGGTTTDCNSDVGRVLEFGDRLNGAIATMRNEVDELAARRPHPDSHLYLIEEALRERSTDLGEWLEEEYNSVSRSWFTESLYKRAEQAIEQGVTRQQAADVLVNIANQRDNPEVVLDIRVVIDEILQTSSINRHNCENCNDDVLFRDGITVPVVCNCGGLIQ